MTMDETAQIVTACLAGTATLVTAVSAAYCRVRRARDEHTLLMRAVDRVGALEPSALNMPDVPRRIHPRRQGTWTDLESG